MELLKFLQICPLTPYYFSPGTTSGGFVVIFYAGDLQGLAVVKEQKGGGVMVDGWEPLPKFYSVGRP
jgi:hypothetical protein